MPTPLNFRSHLTRRSILLAALLAIAIKSCYPVASAQTSTHPPETLSTPAMQVTVLPQDGALTAMFSVSVDHQISAALSTTKPLLVYTDDGIEACPLTSARRLDHALLLEGECSAGHFEQRLALTSEPDVLDISTRLVLSTGAHVHSVEDRYNFMPARHTQVDEHTGPLDFVWSQNIKSEADDLIPANSFKSPAVMMQQGAVFAAILPLLNSRHVEVRALDLDVTSSAHPWMSFGAIPSEPHGHSYFRRAKDAQLAPINNTIFYRYRLVLSAQPPRLGYRRIVRLLWQQTGHTELLASAGEQRNALRPELHSFESWRSDAWITYANRIYTSFNCGPRACGTLASNRSVTGDWQKTEPDAWFNAWFETLRTAYGWYVHGRAVGDHTMMDKAESVLNLALTAPHAQGAFPTIYLVNQHKWVPGDGWASYADSYHAFSMSWTAYWMLRWAEDLTPDRKAEVLAFVKPYGDFLLRNQLASGVIPSWYKAGTLEPRPEFRDFNAETAASALLLAALSHSSGDIHYLAAAERAMSFMTREVLPRQRWFDFETYLSCARKDFSFFDSWTAQYPQNNLAEIQAPQAMLALYQATGKAEYLQQGEAMLDYLLLTQQVWNNPAFTPRLLGGFTTQNTDNEWSDARQGYAATLLADYYQATGNIEYLERAVAAARATFAVAPWENWAHSGFRDEPGGLTGFHWGTGSAMTSIEMMQPALGDAFIDAKSQRGVGFDECTLDAVNVVADAVSFHIESPDTQRSFRVRFRGLEAKQIYKVRWNDGAPRQVSGAELETKEMDVGPLSPPGIAHDAAAIVTGLQPQDLARPPIQNRSAMENH